MNWKWTSINCAFISLAANSFAITGSAIAQPEARMMLTTKAPAAHKAMNAYPAPQAGIKLIEFISQKMHLMKGSVIAKSVPYSPPVEKNQGPTNQLLAIKPPVTTYGGPRDAEREIASDKEQKRKRVSYASEEAQDDGATSTPVRGALMRRQGATNFQAKKDASGGAQRTSDAPASVYGRLANGPLAKSLANLGGALQQVDNAQRLAEGARVDAVRAKSRSASRAEASYTIASTQPRTGVWEPAPSQAGGFAYNSKDLRQSPAGAGGAPSAESATSDQAKAPPLPAANYRNNYQRLPQTTMGKNVQQSADAMYSGGTTGSSVIRDYSHTQAQQQTTLAAVPPPMMAGMQQQSIALPPQSSAAQSDSDAQSQSQHFGALNKQKSEIAMLPPNVITGIPLVRLGSSAIDANKALTSVKGNKLKQQSISGWTVYVLHKANSQDPAMHVYVRHGLVEAMRIFDNAFISPDFGVQLNDDITKVKAKFGEPTFMVSEFDCPASRSSKNYVYPISQVSFELTKTNDSPTPKVVSLLIFTVK